MHAENALQREAFMHMIAAVVNRHAESMSTHDSLFPSSDLVYVDRTRHFPLVERGALLDRSDCRRLESVCREKTCHPNFQCGPSIMADRHS